MALLNCHGPILEKLVFCKAAEKAIKGTAQKSRTNLPKKTRFKGLHGFTHGGKEQLVRQATGSDIISSYTDAEVRGLVQESMPIAFLTALLTTAFLDYPAEHQSAVAMLNECT
jgi:hypothetical protein